MHINLAFLLQEQAAAQPHSPALLDGSGGAPQRVTFAQLDYRTGQAAALLRQLGLKSGDRILLFHPMAAELYVALGAIFRLGLTALFVDPSAGRQHIDRCCRLAHPAAMLATPKAHLLRLASPELRRIPVKFVTGIGIPGAIRWQRLEPLQPDGAIEDCSADTPALATFTSGSTGLPKMAVRSHGFLRQQHFAVEETLGLGPGDIVLSTLPVFVLSHVASGACTLIPNVDIRHPGRVEAAPLARQIVDEQVNCIEGSPALFERIGRHCAAGGTTLPGVRKVFTGGAPVFPDLLQRLQEVMPNATVTAVYGSTEAEPVAHISLGEIAEDDVRAMIAGAGLLAGQVVSAAQVRIVPDTWGTAVGPLDETAFEEWCLDAGQTGEIVVSGPHVLRGYWQGEGDAETKFRVGDTVWHRTGDAGYFDAQGRLWLLGRCIAKIEDERGVIYPFAVECAAHQFPSVRHAAFVAHDGRRLLALELYDDLYDNGEALAAPLGAATTNPPRDDSGIDNSGESESASKDVAAALHADLKWAHVDEVRILKRLPVDRRHNAKVDYDALRRVLSGQ